MSAGFDVPQRQEAVDDSLDSAEGRVRQRDVGRRLVDLHGQHQRVDQHVVRTRSSATCSFRSARPPTISTAVIVLAANLFAETIMAIDAKTGKRAWHFQGVHHGVWDYDFPGRRRSSSTST